MTQLTATQLAWLHAELGTPPTDQDLQTSFDEHGTVREVAIAHLRALRSKWIRQPLSVSVAGVASMSFSENVKAVDRRIAALSNMDPDPSDDPVLTGEDDDGRFQQVQLTRTRRR